MPANKYYLKSGEQVVGTSKIANMLDKGDGITNWAHKIAYDSTIELTHELWVRYGGSEKLYIPKYEDIKKWQGVRDSAGDIGTLVHDLVLDFLSGEVVELKDKDDIVKNCFRKFCDWWVEETKGCTLELITEQPLVSEKLRFGGQPDIYVVNKRKLIDIKTSGGIYDSYWTQLAGYDILLRENGYKVDEYQILWLPKDGRFGCPIRKNLTKEKKIFKCLLEIHKLRREE